MMCGDICDQCDWGDCDNCPLDERDPSQSEECMLWLD